jgi:hypothetical protein
MIFFAAFVAQWVTPLRWRAGSLRLVRLFPLPFWQTITPGVRVGSIPETAIRRVIMRYILHKTE